MLFSRVVASALSVFSIVLGVTASHPGFEVVEIHSPDESARARFISVGAALTNFWVKDKYGKFRDIIIGFDNLTEYTTPEAATLYFGPVVGRYANRIRNGTFTIPISKDASGPGEKFQVPENTNNGTATLHGGFNGYNSRQWSVVTKSPHSVTFSLVDPDGEQGFPGEVLTAVTYTLKSKSTWQISMHAWATKKTPIMLSGHHFWNFEAYQETQDLVGHIVQFDSSRIVATDPLLIPTGEFLDVEGTPLDFRQAKSIGASIPDTAEAQFCGAGCVGFDNCWVYDNNDGRKPIFSVWSVNSGIKLDVTTNQAALQIYTCNGVAPGLARKKDQGGPDAFYEDHSCMVIEQESLIDSINNPEFGVDDIFGPERPYDWEVN
ncbi:galactose mutarotase-like protein [Dendrothele bispora CBS 962.96]|uniref:Galactose mutarotase-like protein n=1 Tax=Dendrothele bispora (strain CBS 962.96) TaxID=1314807 RepID=A0A4S8MYM2_DENBC|nr:galactose mutarotase-like protein [Dendrothele bispora CBS 962.96]